MKGVDSKRYCDIASSHTMISQQVTRPADPDIRAVDVPRIPCSEVPIAVSKDLHIFLRWQQTFVRTLLTLALELLTDMKALTSDLQIKKRLNFRSNFIKGRFLYIFTTFSIEFVNVISQCNVIKNTQTFLSLDLKLFW